MTEDQIKRVKIPNRSDLKTDYHPRGNFVMILPLPDITQIGQILLPNRSTIRLNEGHVLEVGPMAQDAGLKPGDCVTWDLNTENRMDVDGVPFLLVADSCILMVIPRAELEALQAAEDKLPKPAPQS